MQRMNHDNAPTLQEIDWWGRWSYAAQYKIQEIVRILSDLDAEHNLALEELERRSLGGKAQEDAIEKLRAAHRERRRPYVTQLEELRGGFPALASDEVPQES